MAEPGTITIKVVLDTTEAEAQIAGLQKRAADLKEAPCFHAGPVKQTVGRSAIEISGSMAGCRFSLLDAEYLISCIRARIS